MLENAMPGETLQSNGVPAENLKAASHDALPKKTLQDMAEKLEKSEAGRKKLRQAISMLKEKVEANEKVLQVNEILRQECEKERLRAEAERNRAEEEKNLREQIEQDGFSAKEQVVRILQRLDVLERSRKSDRDEIERMRKEMKQATSGLGGAVEAIEAAHSSFQDLEKNVLGKVSSAVAASTKATSLTETAVSDGKRAQGTAVAAEKLSQSLVSKVELLQKQSAGLDQRVTLLQQEIRMRHLDPLHNSLQSNGNKGFSFATDETSVPGKGMVSKYQERACAPETFPGTATNKDFSPGSASGLGPEVTPGGVILQVVNRVKQQANRDSVGKRVPLTPKTRHGANVTAFTGIEPVPDSQAKEFEFKGVSSSDVVSDKAAIAGSDNSRLPSSSGNSVREALDAAKLKRPLLRTISSNIIPQRGLTSSAQRSTMPTLVSTAPPAARDYPVEGGELTGRIQDDSGDGSMPAVMLGYERNYGSPHGVCVGRRAEGNHGTNVEYFPGRRVCIKEDTKPSRAPEDSGAETKLVVVDPLPPKKERKSEMLKGRTRITKNGQKSDRLPVALLKDIAKLFLKEKKAHSKVEQKLAVLQGILQKSEDYEVLVDGKQKKTGKRKRLENSKDIRKKKPPVQGAEKSLNVTSNDIHVVASDGHIAGRNVTSGAVELEASKLKTENVSTTEKDSAARPLRPPANESRNSQPRGSPNVVAEPGVRGVQNSNCLDGHQLPDVGVGVAVTSPSLVCDNLTAAAPKVMTQSQRMGMDAENVSRCVWNGEWDTDSESSEDEFGEDWWTAKRVLLSPTLPEVLPPSVWTEEPELNAPSSWPGNLEDISLFLDVLPPINQGQELCEEDRIAATLITDAKLGIEVSHTQLGVAPLNGEQCEELQSGLVTEASRDFHICKESATSNDLVHCVESGCKASEKPGDCVVDEPKESLIDGPPFHRSSMCSGSQSESSHLLTQDVSVVTPGKSEVLLNRSIDSGASNAVVFSQPQAAVKEETEQCATVKDVENFAPYSLELVLGSAVHESGVNSTGSTMQQGFVISMSDLTDGIIAAFGRTRNIFLGALGHTADGAFASSCSVTASIASLFASSSLPKMDLMCILTASVVDSHALWVTEKNASRLNSECESLELLINIIKQVLATKGFENVLSPDQAFLLFAAQLRKFLIKGSIQPLLQGTAEEEDFAEGHAMENFFHFTTSSSKPKRLRALISGGKLLAILCESIGNLDFLRNSIYCVLRFCDMDSQSLLATISSFACGRCRKSLFLVDKGDVVGQAVQVVISELIHDVDMIGHTEASSAQIKEIVELQMEMQQHGSCTGAAEENIGCAELLQNLRAFRELIGEEDGLSFEAFVPRLVELFHRIITTTLSSHLKHNRHLFQRCLCMIKPKNLVDQRFKMCQTDVNIGGSAPQLGVKYGEDYCWPYTRVKHSIQAVSQSEHDADHVEEGEQEFYDITSAVELVASHLGWEWTYNDFIVEHLWKLVSPGAPAITVACVAHMFGLLGRLGREVDSTELPGVDELRKSLLVILGSDRTGSISNEGFKHHFSFRAQVAAAQALLVLSSFNRKDEIIPRKDGEKVFSKSSELHVKSVKSLWNWVKAFKLEIQEVLPSSVRNVLLSIDKSNFVPIF